MVVLVGDRNGHVGSSNAGCDGTVIGCMVVLGMEIGMEIDPGS